MQPPRPDSLEIRRARRSVRAALIEADEPALSVGPYEVLGLLGTGGFSTVWLARDERLQRNVAIKRLVRTEDDRVGRRLRQEAQMVARVEHPNVLQVFDVVESGGSNYAVFEHVEGPDLNLWLADERSTEEIDALFRAIAAGVQAVHDVGLAHGDFKPANVMVAPPATPKLLDFGLSLTVGEPPSLRGGTPAYMAPEQRISGEASVAADQYALCMAWLEALGEPIRSPPGSSVPHEIRVLRRGISEDPEDRWPSITALLAALTPRRHRRFTALWGAAAVTVVIASALSLSSTDATCPPGTSPATSLDPDALSAVLVQANPSGGAAMATRVTRAVETWTEQWHEARVTVCQVGSDDVALGLRCLEQQQQRVDAQLRALVEQTRPAYSTAAAVIAGLPTPGQCSTATGSSQLSVDPSIIDGLYTRLYGIDDDPRGGAVEQDEQHWRDLIADAQRAGATSVQAEAQVILAQHLHLERRQDEAIAAAESAYELAVAPLDAPLRTRAATLVAAYHAQELDEEKAYRWARVAMALQESGATSHNDAAVLQTTLGIMAAASEDLERAAEHFDRGLELASEASVRMPQVEAAILANYSEVRLRLRLPAEGLQMAERALQLYSTSFGEDPQLVGYLINVGKAAIAADRRQRAEDALLQGHRMAQALGPDHPFTGAVDLLLAQLFQQQERWEAAAPYARAAAAFAERRYGADDPRTAEALAVASDVLLHMGATVEAQSMAIRAVEIQRPDADDEPAFWRALILLGKAQLAAGACEAGVAALREAAVHRQHPAAVGDLPAAEEAAWQTAAERCR